MAHLFITERLTVREATESDIPAVIALEEHPENRDYLWVGTVEEHKAEIADPNHILAMIDLAASAENVGYALIRLDRKSDRFELRRIAISEKNRGYGREAMGGFIRYAFTVCNTNRFWLDAYADNAVGIHLYESLGFHLDGILRANYKSDRGYEDQYIFSMLKSEFSDD